MIIQRPKALCRFVPLTLRLARPSLTSMYEIGNTSSLPFWRTSTLRRLHRPLSIISCIPAPCPEPPVWSLEAITRHRHSEATRTGYGLARRRPYQPRPLGAPPSVDSIDDPFSLQSGRGAEKAHRNADARQLLLLRWKNYYGKKKIESNKIRKQKGQKRRRRGGFCDSSSSPNYISYIVPINQSIALAWYHPPNG